MLFCFALLWRAVFQARQILMAAEAAAKGSRLTFCDADITRHFGAAEVAVSGVAQVVCACACACARMCARVCALARVCVCGRAGTRLRVMVLRRSCSDS